MSKTTLLLIVTLFASVAVHSVSSVAADSFAITNGSFYKEKGSAKLVAAGDASLAYSTTSSISRQLIAGKNSKTNWYVYTTNTPTDITKSDKGGTTTVVFKKVDVNKLAFAEGDGSTVSVTGFKWGDSDAGFAAGASVKNNVTLLTNRYVDAAVDNAIMNVYAYVIDLSKNEKTEVIVAAGAYTSLTDQTSVAYVGSYYTGVLTVILYSTTVVKDTSTKLTYSMVTLKGTTLGTPVTVKEYSWTTTEPTESIVGGSFSGTGENAVVVFQNTATGSLDTETVYTYTVTEKEIKAGTTTVLNTQVAVTNQYNFLSIHPHSEGRWIAVYTNRTGDAAPYTRNLLAKASNDTSFKVLSSTVDVDGTSYSTDVYTYFGGLVVFSTQNTMTTGTDFADQVTESYQTFGGDLTALGTKTNYVSYAGSKYRYVNVQPYRLGDTKAINVLINQVAYDSTAAVGSQRTSEGLYFGQLFQKSFGATLQSILAVCSLTLAALFFF